MAEPNREDRLPDISGDVTFLPAPSASGLGPAETTRPTSDIPRIDGYEIIGKLGEGGMGVVWRAVQLSTKREVALKLINPAFMGSEKVRARFEREVELAASLEHPNIARVYDSGLRQAVYCYAMELIDGVPIDEYAPKHSLTQQQILQVMRTACGAIQHAHQHGVIHTDLKPSNILVSNDGQPHILDFGLAKSFMRSDSPLTISGPGQLVGTPIFMSPEQAAGQRDQLDVRSDVYSLGVILFLLLTGEHPHDISGPTHEVLRRIAAEEVRRPCDVAKAIGCEVEALLLKALEHDPLQRYADAGEFGTDIERYLRGDPLFAKPAARLYTLRRRWRKHRGAILLTGLGAGVGASLLALISGNMHIQNAPTAAKDSVSPPLQTIRELWSTPTGFRNALAGDVDGDGKADVIAGDGTGYAIFNGQGRQIFSKPNVGNLTLGADMNGDGRADIFCTERSEQGLAKTTAYDSAGKAQQSYWVRGGEDTVLTPFRVEDLDSDGHLEVLAIIGSSWTAGPRGVVVFDAVSGKELGRTEVGPAVHRTPWVGPLAGDVRSRIIFGGTGVRNGRTGPDGSNDSSSYVWCLDPRGNTIWRRGPFDTDGYCDTEVVVPEVRTDKRRDIIVSIGRHGWNDWETHVGQLIMLDASGEAASGDFVRDFHSPIQAVGAPNLGPTGKEVILVVHEDPDEKSFYIRALKLEPGFPDWRIYDAGANRPDVSTIRNSNKNGSPQILCTAGNKLTILSNDLRPLWSWTSPDGEPLSGAKAADLNADGIPEVLVASGESRNTCRVHVLQIP